MTENQRLDREERLPLQGDNMKNGGSAFPGYFKTVVVENMRPVEKTIVSEGMTLRDYFAGQALLGFVQGGVYASENCAKVAYMLADAMLAEREKRE